jgi:hypothetical protein
MVFIAFCFFSSVEELKANDITSHSSAVAIGIMDGGEYQDDITVLTTGTDKVVLNGMEVTQGFVINEIGYHTMELYLDDVLLETINFTIIPRFTEDLDGTHHFDKVNILLENKGTLYVNNRLKEIGERFTDIGYYNVRVEGINGYEVEYNFLLENYKLFVIDGTEYTFDVVIDVSDYYAVYMYNMNQNTDVRLGVFGNYEVRVLGLNGFYKTYTFSIGPNFNNYRDGGVYEVDFIRVDKSEAQTLYIDNVKYTGIRHLTEVGNHQIRFTGLNGYEKIYNITIKEKDLGIDNKIFETFSHKFKGYDVYLNGKEYKTGEEIKQIGYYTVTIKGVNGYVNEYEILVRSETELPEGETNKAFNLYTEYKTVLVNGGKVHDGYRITETGDYLIELYGEKGYKESYQFSYVNEHEDMASELYYVAGILGFFVLTTYGVLAWRKFK